MKQEEESTYDPKVHGALWHNDNPFVVEQYRERLKKCRGCATLFVNCKDPTPVRVTLLLAYRFSQWGWAFVY